MEFVHMVAAHHLVRGVGMEGEVELPIPLQVGCPTALPGWSKSGTRWLTAVEYGEEVLGTRALGRDRIASLASVYRCDVRLSQLYNHLFGSPPAETLDLRSSFLEGLGHLYRVHGETLRDPGCPIPVKNGQLGPAEVLHFLRAVYETNHDAAERIFDQTAL